MLRLTQPTPWSPAGQDQRHGVRADRLGFIVPSVARVASIATIAGVGGSRSRGAYPICGKSAGARQLGLIVRWLGWTRWAPTRKDGGIAAGVPPASPLSHQAQAIGRLPAYVSRSGSDLASWPSALWTEREGQPRKRPAVRNGAAVKLAVLSGFLRAGGDPPHSVSLTEEGRSLLMQRGIA